MKSIGEQTSFAAGQSFVEKDGPPNSYLFGIGIDHRSNPSAVSVNPKSVKISGSTVVDLPMWGERACDRTFFYGDAGNIYKEESGLTKAYTASESQGNGMVYFPADKALYYAQNTTFGRLLDACTANVYYDDFLGTEGGAPTNTNSILFVASSSQYASRADTASTSITLDLTLEVYSKPESLPTTGNTMTLLSKWDENTDLRSYKMDLTTVSNFFGDGSDGALTISSNTTEAPIDSSAVGTSGTYALTATNASFAADQQIMIHQTRGTNAGVVQYTKIQSYTAGTITTTDALDISFNSTGSNKAQVRVMKQHTNVTVNTGITYTAKAWNGTVGGILGFYANGTVTVTGTITAKAKGFRFGRAGQNPNGGSSDNITGEQGEGTTGAGGTRITGSNGSGGGGGGKAVPNNGSGNGGGGAGHSLNGGTGLISPGTSGTGGVGGSSSGSSNLTTMTFGGGGGGGGFGDSERSILTEGDGGTGGGIVSIFGVTTTVSGSINSQGDNSNFLTASSDQVNGGGGAGGSILLKCQTATLGTGLLTATGGISSAAWQTAGGVGSTGIIHVDYLTSVTGTTSPAYTSAVDSNLGSADGYALRLQISDDGTASGVESYTQEVTSQIAVGEWARWQVTWDASASTAEFFKNGVSLGAKTGSKTEIDNNASGLALACDFNSSAQNFYDGYMDDVRVWNDIRTDSELINKDGVVLVGTEANLIAYYKLDGDVTDSQTDGNNNLTASGTPTYSEDIPFSGLTTRKDEDQRNEQTGQTYTLTTAINEGATHRQSFVPAKDPQESIEVAIAAIGTGDWTITVHDALNRTVAELTVVKEDLNTGFYDFIFSSVWTPIIGATYHFHLTSTVADGTVVTGVTSDLETVRFRSHYQFLISNKYHPMERHLDFWVMGNGRYLAKFQAGDIYEPHKLTFPSEYNVRCLASWREFKAIGCWKGNSITDFDDGRIFFWDGIYGTYNHSIKVPEGGVNAMYGTQDVLFIVAGYTGELLVYNGGGAAQKFHKLPKVTRDKYIEIAPGAMNMWRSNIQLGASLNTDSEAFHQGIYSIGTSQRQYPMSFGFDYLTTLGDQTASTVKLGLVFPSGQDLYTGWQNSNTYGIDKISVGNDSFASATIEMLITDMGSVAIDDYPLLLRADFKRLITGQKIRVKYKADREGSWKESDWADSVDANQIRLPIKERMKEIQVAIDLESSVSTQTEIYGVTLEVKMEKQNGRRI